MWGGCGRVVALPEKIERGWWCCGPLVGNAVIPDDAGSDGYGVALAVCRK
jgi:hypothetical protein